MDTCVGVNVNGADVLVVPFMGTNWGRTGDVHAIIEPVQAKPTQTTKVTIFMNVFIIEIVVT